MKKIFLIGFVLLLPVSGVFAYGLSTLSGLGFSSTPPAYYSIDDLSNELCSNMSFYFADANQPSTALVKLDTTPLSPCSTNKRAAIAAVLRMNPYKYKVKAACICCNSWTDNDMYAFDWSGFMRANGRKGDLVFLRSDGGYSSVIKLFSGWTHVAIVYNPSLAQVLEAMPGGGVKVNHAPDTWGNVSYYTCKSVAGVSPAQADALVENGRTTYSGLPYIPQISKTSDIVTFAYKWANKDDKASMYCSKLVYNVYKTVSKTYLAPDNGTSLTDAGDGPRLWNAPCGYNWVGVSPDDIYYSSNLNGDFAYSPNLTNDTVDFPAGIKK